MRKKLLSTFVAALLAAAGCTEKKIEKFSWPSMGTVASVQTREKSALPALESSAKKAFADVAKLLNRFDGSSEINALSGRSDADVVRLSSSFSRPCYETAFLVERLSSGAFNPRWRGEGTLDLGAVAKGFALDEAKKLFLSENRSAHDALLDLGGNLLSCSGRWKAGVKNPSGEGFSAIVDLEGGEALATSGSYYRGEHIIDARKGGAVSNFVSSVTVLSLSAMWADALSTTLFILGPEEGAEFLEKAYPSVPGGKSRTAVLWIMRDGRTVKAGAKDRFTEPR